MKLVDSCKVSIIVPIYNREHYVDKIVVECNKQTYSNWELIFVDDGSTDNTAEIINKYTIQSSNILLLKQNNNGPSSARNLGLKKSKGEYVQFLDSDDYLDPMKLEKNIRYFILHPEIEFVYSYIWYINESNHKIRLAGQKIHPSDKWQYLAKNCWHTVAPLYKRSIINKVGYWDESIKGVDDLDFATRVKLNAKKFGFIEEGLAYCRSDNMDKITYNYFDLNFTASIERYSDKLVSLKNQYNLQNQQFKYSISKWYKNALMRYLAIQEVDRALSCLLKAKRISSKLGGLLLLLLFFFIKFLGGKNVYTIIRLIKPINEK